jgi:hypothetical protein
VINNEVALPGDFTNPQYVITGPSTLVPVDHHQKVIVFRRPPPRCISAEGRKKPPMPMFAAASASGRGLL